MGHKTNEQRYAGQRPVDLAAADARYALHERDGALLRRARTVLSRWSNKYSTRTVARPVEEWQPLEKLIDDYDAACELATGPLPDRSRHWSKVAGERWLELCEFLEQHTGDGLNK